MPRNARIDIPGCLYHVIGRGNAGQRIFIDEIDYSDFLSRLHLALDKTNSKCLAWCLMPNHFHLLILRGERPLSELMRRLMTGYVGNYNWRHHRYGHLFQNRYKSVLCQEEKYLLELVAYIHLNPLRAGLVKGYENLKKYCWSGHNEITSLARAKIVDRYYILEHFGEETENAVCKYEQFVCERTTKFKNGELSGGGLARSFGGIVNTRTMNRISNKKISDERILGSEEFVQSLIKQAEKTLINKKINSEYVMKQVCNKTGVTAEEIKSSSRARHIVDARARYCYLAKESGISGTILSDELGRNSGAISYLSSKGRLLEQNN